MNYTKQCEHCDQLFETKDPDARFDKNKCRAAWHRLHDPRGQIVSVRRLVSGAVSVTLRFHENEAERAIRFMPKTEAVLGELP